MAWQKSQKKKKKTIIYWILVFLLIIASIAGIVYYVSQKGDKERSEKKEKEQLQTQLNFIKRKVNSLSDNTKKSQLHRQLSNLENQINSLSRKNIKPLQQEIEAIKQELKGEDKPKPNPDKPNEFPKTPHDSPPSDKSPPSDNPTPEPNDNSEKKKLADLIKADLRDALTNDSRWKVQGLQHHFHDYQNWASWIYAPTQNEEIKKELEKNRIRNYDKREEDFWKQESDIILPGELEAADFQEILNLISQIRTLREQKDQQKSQKVYQKLASRKGLIYWDGAGKRVSSNLKGDMHYGFRAKENGQKGWVNIAHNHPVLSNFSFDSEGIYLITGIENILSKKKGDWFRKHVELGDKITLTPFNE